MVTETLSGAAMAKAEDDAPLQPQQASVNGMFAIHEFYFSSR